MSPFVSARWMRADVCGCIASCHFQHSLSWVVHPQFVVGKQMHNPNWRRDQNKAVWGFRIKKSSKWEYGISMTPSPLNIMTRFSVFYGFFFHCFLCISKYDSPPHLLLSIPQVSEGRGSPGHSRSGSIRSVASYDPVPKGPASAEGSPRRINEGLNAYNRRHPTD